MNLIAIFNFVKFIINKYSIDESHGLIHSMAVLNYAKEIYNHELITNPTLIDHERIIYTCAILHDMCDKKYMNELEGLNNIKQFLISEKYDKYEIENIIDICSTMSYSYVKKNGYPFFKNINTIISYHIVREADLLAALDFDRCIIYDMNKKNNNILLSFDNALNLFNKRMFKHNEDNLYVTEYSKYLDIELKQKAINKINDWKEIIKLNN
jgi:hypothetical protein